MREDKKAEDTDKHKWSSWDMRNEILREVDTQAVLLWLNIERNDL